MLAKPEVSCMYARLTRLLEIHAGKTRGLLYVCKADQAP
jgi:hypothetical protein